MRRWRRRRRPRWRRQYDSCMHRFRVAKPLNISFAEAVWCMFACMLARYVLVRAYFFLLNIDYTESRDWTSGHARAHTRSFEYTRTAYGQRLIYSSNSKERWCNSIYGKRPKPNWTKPKKKQPEKRNKMIIYNSYGTTYKWAMIRVWFGLVVLKIDRIIFQQFDQYFNLF